MHVHIILAGVCGCAGGYGGKCTGTSRFVISDEGCGKEYGSLFLLLPLSTIITIVVVIMNRIGIAVSFGGSEWMCFW